ncbi:winged helix-turn-helix domain-containing protein, partial [Clostridium sp.]
MGSVKTKRKLLDYLESNSKDNIFTISTKKKIAESVGVSVSTINNNLKKLEEENKIAVATKKGHNGGIVITLIKERFNTEDLVEFNKSNDNIIQSAQKYAEDLRDKHFPTYTYQRKENRRRTKQEMAKYKAIKDKNRRIILDMNLELSNMNYPSKEVFNMSYDPEGFYKAYILCKLYDTYC